MERRRSLALLGAAAVAGCSGSEDENGDESNEGPSDNGNGGDGTSEDESETTDSGETDSESGSTDDGENDSGEDGSQNGDNETEPEPEFSVTEIEHPDTVTVEEEYTISVTVENSGDGDGTFEEPIETRTESEDVWIEHGSVTINNVPAEDTATDDATLVSLIPGNTELRVGGETVEFSVVPAEPEGQTYAGSGQEVRQNIELEEGLTVIEATHSGASNFQVALADGSQFDDYFINVIGEFDGAQAELIDGGSYILDVNADGDWEITVTQPRAVVGELLPHSYEGSGPDVVGPIDVPIDYEGSPVATATHDGESNFQVQILPPRGSFPEIIFNEIGEFDGSTTFSYSGVGWVDINADGNWTLELE